MEGIPALRVATSVLFLLDSYWNLAAGDCAIAELLTAPLGATAFKENSSVTEVIENLRALLDCGDVHDLEGSNHEKELAVLANKCSAQAGSVLDILEAQAPSEHGTEWKSFQHDWESLRHGQAIANASSCLAQYGTQLGAWLLDALSDEKWPVNDHLRQIQKEADTVSSVRAREIAVLKKDVLSALGHHSNRGGFMSKETRRRDYPKGSAHSSNSSGNETPQIRRVRKKRHHRQIKDQSAPQQIPADNSALGLPGWLPKVKQMLAAMCNWAEVVPVEIRLLKHLVYESIDSREDSIREAESGTFGWMLDDAISTGLPPHMDLARNSFIKWLESGSGVFHISGNAGAGKSTLMKFLRHHQRTRSELTEWAGERKLIFSSFYFWNSGSLMQMSLEGLYRSLLLEVSRNCPDLILALFPEEWKALSTIPKGSAIDETLFGPQGINDAFARLLTLDISQKYRMCFFIDGLDEYTGDNVDYGALARRLRQWATRVDGVKLCVSARPYREFLDGFDPSLRLHLHELTAHDIKAFAHDSFERTDGVTLLSEEKLVNIIIHKSEGVFLWARVVVRSLIGMAKRGITEAKLSESLETYPTDIEELYDSMLGSLKSEEKVRSNQMLLLAARNPFAQALNALCFSWIDELDGPGFPLIKRPYSATEVSNRHVRVRSDLEHMTKGLLEMHTDRRERKDGDQFYRQRLQFFHRTARDYLRSPARLEQLQHSFGSTNLVEIFARLRLAEIVLAGKYKANAGADPRRRRLYFNYARSLFSLRDEHGNKYQIPRRYLLSLKEDLRVTESPKFSSPYAVSCYISISNHHIVDEDPEKAASFLHFALCQGQHLFVFDDIRERIQLDPQKEELSLVLSGAFGQRKFPPEELGMLLAHSKSLLAKIRIKPSFGKDPLATKSYQLGILTVFVSTLVFACIGAPRSEQERRVHSTDRKNVKDLFVILGHLLEAAVRERHQVASALGRPPQEGTYLCLLRKTEQMDKMDASNEVIYTTLGQLALRYAPSEAERLLPLLGETQSLGSDSAADAEFQFPSWARDRLTGDELNQRALFITSDHLDGHFCHRVSSANESVAADDNLFLRIY
ncbi:hypothetical protein BJ170DRAFT_190690 [Xylariales sp. AK1849]|nr:hypothetical protein BJ170DRAFT_190690 [Xylariales sp. AK1849]